MLEFIRSPEDVSREVGIAQDLESWVGCSILMSPERSGGRYLMSSLLLTVTRCRPTGLEGISMPDPAVILLGYGLAS